MNDLYYYIGTIVFWVYAISGAVYLSIISLDFIGTQIIKVLYRLCSRIGLLFEYVGYREEFKEWINTHKRDFRTFFSSKKELSDN